MNHTYVFVLFIHVFIMQRSLQVFHLFEKERVLALLNAFLIKLKGTKTHRKGITHKKEDGDIQKIKAKYKTN